MFYLYSVSSSSEFIKCVYLYDTINVYFLQIKFLIFGICKVFGINFLPSIVVRGLRAPLYLLHSNNGQARRPCTTIDGVFFVKLMPMSECAYGILHWFGNRTYRGYSRNVSSKMKFIYLLSNSRYYILFDLG